MDRLPVYYFYNALFIIFTVITGFSNSIGMIVIFRFLTDAATIFICLNPSIVSDMFALQGRCAVMFITSLISHVRTAVGSIIDDYLTQHLSWRWIFWLTVILTDVVELVMIFVFWEIYLSHILRRREKTAPAALTLPWRRRNRKLLFICCLVKCYASCNLFVPSSDFGRRQMSRCTCLLSVYTCSCSQQP